MVNQPIPKSFSEAVRQTPIRRTHVDFTREDSRRSPEERNAVNDDLLSPAVPIESLFQCAGVPRRGLVEASNHKPMHSRRFGLGDETSAGKPALQCGRHTDPGQGRAFDERLSPVQKTGSLASPTTVWLFVYGTLKPGERLHSLIGRYVKSHQPAKIIAKLADLGAYPGLVFGFGYVKGFLLEVEEAALEITDRIEGVDVGLYRRKRTLSATRDSVKWCLTYEYAREKIEASESLVTAEERGVPVYEWHGSK